MLTVGSTSAIALEGGAHTNALRHGGYVLVMRHASYPGKPPTRTLGAPKIISELGDGGQSMQKDTAQARAAWH